MTTSPTMTTEKAKHSEKVAEGSFTELHGELFYRIANYDAMPAFFMSIVSHSDHYLFISSNGGLTAGRKDADHALFPYYTDDRIHENHENTGSKTILRVHGDEGTVLWEPFSARSENATDTQKKSRSRNLYKSVYGNKIVFEEVNHGLGLTFSYEWAISDRFGFVRTVRLTNLTDDTKSIEVLDGVQNLLPCGLTKRFQMEYSTLGDGYKRTELEPESGLCLVQLTSVPVDRPEPSESLRANVAWSTGLNQPKHLLSSVQLDRFREGYGITEETDMHGQRAAYFVSASLRLAPSTTRSWKIVGDVNLDGADVRNLLHTLKQEDGLAEKVTEDVALGTTNLMRIVAASDGLQQTQDMTRTWHHFASTLFNVMRGGIPEDDYGISREDFARFVFEMNHAAAEKHSAFLAALPERLLHSELLQVVGAEGDVDLERIALEYLPLTFSRRHGDPSRPWNVFDIRVKDEQGRKILNYQGNWRDIFQNWEALSNSYPGYTVSMIFKFLDSSTADGYNPYRVSRDGYDWEVLEPHDAWSFIGYWGDHQVIYLLRLLEQAHRYDPASLRKLLAHEVFTYANVPYRIKPYADLLKDPHDTIVFDQDAHRRTLRKAERMGGDGKALAAADGQLIHANLAEKILVVLLAKLSNFVPEAGLWLNTQRPEWNDANNALVGNGASMVTLYHLRRFLLFVHNLFAERGVEQLALPVEVAAMLESMAETLERRAPKDGKPISDQERKATLDELGKAGSEYRESIYGHGFSGERRGVKVSALTKFFDIALLHVDHSIRANRRADGLYHAYNILGMDADGIRVQNLALMLEGQVAVLSSGALSAEEASSLLDSLRASALYRPDQNSYILYPIKVQKSFLNKNNISVEEAAKSKLLTEMIAAGDRRIVSRDAAGGIHFNGAFLNAGLLRQALGEIKDRKLARLVKQESEMICQIYEDVFQHRFFLGRSETFYKYEGIGCIYWHMVSKLLLAVREVLTDAVRDGVAEPVRLELEKHYNDIRCGLGMHKTPVEYGAVPMDPYSHTPGFAGAQQPGMTGQVKEDFIARMGEMGVSVVDGEIHFVEGLVTSDEFLEAPSSFRYWDVNGEEETLELEAGTLAFTYCQVPVVAHHGGPRQIHVTRTDGSTLHISGDKIGSTISKAIFQRLGDVRRLDVYFGRTDHSKLSE